MEIKEKYIQIEFLLQEIKEILTKEIGYNPYDDLEKSIKIISNKNYNHLISLNKTLKNITILLYNRNLNCTLLVLKKIDKVHEIISEITQNNN